VTFTTPDVSALFCNYFSTDGALPAETSFAGQAGHSFTPTIAHFATSTASRTPLSSAASGKSSSKGTSGATASASAVSSGGAKKNLNKGAVIGGTIGGVLGLALIIGAVILFLKRRNLREPVQQGKAGASSAEEVGGPVLGKTQTVIAAGQK
jgi:hypothetical protein